MIDEKSYFGLSNKTSNVLSLFSLFRLCLFFIYFPHVAFSSANTPSFSGPLLRVLLLVNTLLVLVPGFSWRGSPTVCSFILYFRLSSFLIQHLSRSLCISLFLEREDPVCYLSGFIFFYVSIIPLACSSIVAFLLEKNQGATVLVWSGFLICLQVCFYLTNHTITTVLINLFINLIFFKHNVFL